MEKLIGREHEKGLIQKYIASNRCEFIAVYGRRRVGKTFLIRSIFQNTFDFYSQFYHDFVKKRVTDRHYWRHLIGTPQENTWYGLAFERVCMAHIPQIIHKLRYDTIHTEYYSWKSKESSPAAQIDLVIDRADGNVSICEMKYSQADYSFTKSEYNKMQNRINAFRTETNCRKGIQPVLVTTYRMPKATSHIKVNPQESDEFNSTELGLQWQWHANYNQLWGMPTNHGCLRLYTADLALEGKAFKSLWEAGNLLLQKTPAKTFKATTKIRFASKEDDQYGGIIMMGMDYQALVIRRMSDQFLLQQLNCKNADKGGLETEKTLATLKPTDKDTGPYAPAIYLDIYLQMKVKDGKCQFAYSTDGKHYKDAGDLFTMRQGKWIGAKMGFVSERKNTKGNRGWIDADWFRVTK